MDNPRPCNPYRCKDVQPLLEKNYQSLVKVILPLLLLCFLSFSVSCKKKQDIQEDKGPVLVEVTTVEQGEIAKHINFTGNIEADSQVNVFPQITAVVKEMKVDMGDSVKKGDIIARLESEEFSAQFSQTKAALEVMQAKWAQMQTGARPEEISQAEDLVIKAKANLKEAESNFTRMNEMYKKGSISERQFESAELAYTVAKADLNSARERLLMLKTGATKEDRDALKAQVQQAEAAVELARIRLSYTQITSPFDGTISERFIEPGDLAMPAKPLFTIVRMDRVKVVIGFPGNQIRYMVPGTTARVHVDAYPNEEFVGKIDKVSPTLNPATRLFSAEIGIANEKYLLRPGMFATVMFVVDPHPDALLVPKVSVLYREINADKANTSSGVAYQKHYLFIIEDETARMREVSLGHEAGDIIEILKGVKKGEQVVTQGLHQLKDGDRIKVVN